MHFNIPLIIICYGVLIVWGLFLSVLHKKGFLTCDNFLGKKTFAAYGLVAYPAALTGMILLFASGNTDKQSLLNYAVILSVMWLGGAIDDLFGSRSAGGYMGHINALVRDKKLTTGLIKIVAGIIAGCFSACYFNSGSAAKGIAAFLLVPLSANTVNLFDLRPGRASFFFFISSLLILAICSFAIYDWNICGIMFAVAVISYFWDRSGDAMMGDSYSNVLGAFLGILIVMNLHPAFSWIFIALNIAVQIYSEKHSISKLIEKTPFLRALDSLTGIRH